MSKYEPYSTILVQKIQKAIVNIILILSLTRFYNDAKRCVGFLYSTLLYVSTILLKVGNGTALMGTECLNTPRIFLHTQHYAGYSVKLIKTNIYIFKYYY